MSEQFRPYVNRFLEAAIQYLPFDGDGPRLVNALNSVLIDFGASGPDAVGGCYTRGKRDLKRIHIDPESWVGYSDLTRERIIFHELGHCALNRVHNQTHWKERPLSLMSESLTDLSDEEYKEHRAEYLHELFWSAEIR